VDKLLVVLSDIEMGAGGPLDDFPQSDWLAALMLRYCEPPYADLPVTLVFNGDTFDLLKTSVDGVWPTHVDAEVALAKLERIAAAHRAFFSGVSQFLAHPRAERRVVFVVGNHDAELLMPAVQTRIRALCGVADERLTFAGLAYREGDVHIEHGCQGDPLFAIEPARPLISCGGRELLNLPWGALALLEVAIPLTPVLYHHDRLKPREELLALVPELKRLLLGAFFRYFTRDYWQRYFEDPLRRLSWPMLREIAYRFATGGMDVELGSYYQTMVQSQEQVRLCVVGHSHQPAWQMLGHKKLLQTGCLRNEFALLDQGRSQVPLPKVYAEVAMKGGRCLSSQLVELAPPELPSDYVPASIFDVVEPLRTLLAQRNLLVGDREKLRLETSLLQENSRLPGIELRRGLRALDARPSAQPNLRSCQDLQAS
jgi:UDP-2,3-diacylglucosamine pyrophosphatase LpxH